tara:strand:+ start:664 stop:840 length:177 start_codon:yes stop_codon:yes gene_type:complete
MKSLELEIRGYIIVFGMSFLIACLGGCGQTIQGVGKDIQEVGQTVTNWGIGGKDDKTD